MTLFYEADDEMPKENEQGIMDDTAHAAPSPGEARKADPFTDDLDLVHNAYIASKERLKGDCGAADYELLRTFGRDVILAEAEAAAKAAEGIAAAPLEDIAVPRFVADVGSMDISCVKKSHIQQMDAALERIHTAGAGLAALIGATEERLADAQQRTGGDPALNARLAELEAQRTEAVLDGKDCHALDKELLALAEARAADDLQKRLAAGDVAALDARCAALRASRERVEKLYEKVTARRHVFEACIIAAEYNALAAKLAKHVRRFLELKDQSERLEPGIILPRTCGLGVHRIRIPALGLRWSEVSPDGALSPSDPYGEAYFCKEDI